MANREEYRFDVNANTEQASKAVEDLIKKMSRLEQTVNRIHQKGFENNYTTNQKDMDKSMRSLKQMVDSMYEGRKYIQGAINKAQREMGSLKEPKAPRKNARKEVRAQYEKEKAEYDKQLRDYQNFVRGMIRANQQLNRSLEQTRSNHQDLTGFSQNYSKDFTHKFNRNGIYNMPDDPREAERRMRAIMSRRDSAEDSIQSVVDSTKSVQRLNRRNDSLSRRGVAARYLSDQQAKGFHADYVKSQTSYRDMRESNFKELARLGQERSRLDSKVQDIQQNPEKHGDDAYHKMLGFQGTIKSIDEEIEARKQLNRTLEDTITNMQTFRNNLLQANVETKPKRGTFNGMLYERAPAIGLAMGATFTGAFANLYGQGASISKQLRPDVIYNGQSLGMNGADWNKNIQNSTVMAGLANKLGFTGQDMMSFESAYLQHKGATNVKDIKSAMNNQAIFSRVSGIDANTTSDFFSQMYQTGGMNGNQTKNFQDAFVGAIKESGMQGRQKEQLTALQSIVQNVAQGKNLSNSQLSNITALQGVLASTGNRGLQGQNGADFLNNLNQGITQGFNDPQMRLIFGQGTKYQGLAGRWQLQEQMSKGISDVSNVDALAGYAKTNGGANNKSQNAIFSALLTKMGVQATPQQVSGIMDLYRSGKLNQKSLDDFMKKSDATGKKQSAKNLKNYQNSDAAVNNESDATTAKQALSLYDNQLAETVRKLNGTMGKLDGAVYATIVALGALSGMIAISAASFLASAGVRAAAAGRFGRTIGNMGGKTSLMGKVKNFFTTGKATPTDKPTPNVGPEGVPPGFKRNPSGLFVPDNTPDSASAPKTGFLNKLKGMKIPSGLGKVFEWAGKVALPMAVAGGVYNVATAKKGEKMQAAGGAAGGIWGGLTGATKGASLGARFGPWGALVGGIGGGVLGSGVGSWIGSGVGKVAGKAWGGIKSFFGGSKASAAELSPSEIKKQDAARKSKDQHNTNVQARTEDKRQYNVQNESYNISEQEKQINRMQQVLAQARQQNGIVGTMNGMGAGSGGSLGGGASLTGASGNQAQIWNYFAKQGYSSSAISGILGNLGQETGGTFDPTTQQKGGPGMGLAQWTKGQRWSQLTSWAQQNGMDPMAMSTQLQFMTKEMNQMGLTPDKMNGLSTEQATALFEQKYEGAGKPNMANRNSYANSAYNQFANSPQSSANLSSTSSNATINSNINVSLTGSGDAVQQLSSNSQLQSVGQKIQQMIYGSLAYYSQETTRV